MGVARAQIVVPGFSSMVIELITLGNALFHEDRSPANNRIGSPTHRANEPLPFAT